MTKLWARTIGPGLFFVVATVATAFEQTAPGDWFRGAKFGVRLERGMDVPLWMGRIAKAGARYVVAESPNDELAGIADKNGLKLMDRDSYWNVGQLVPSAPLKPKDGKGTWEARFGMTDSSGGTTPRELIRLLIEVASKGGNLLLSLPPNAQDGVRTLEAMGAWLEANGESVYGTSESPFDRMPFFGRATKKGNVLYLHLFQWPADGKLRVTGLQNEIRSAELLGSKAKLSWSKGVIALPGAAVNDAASVIRLTLDGPPKVTPYFIEPDTDGVITARVESCEFETKSGQVVRKDDAGGRVFLSHWTRAIDVPSWKVHVPRDGRYVVDMVYSAGKESAGVVYTVTMKGLSMGMVKGVVEATGPASRQLRVSDMELERGNYMLFVQPENKAGQPAMALERIILRRTGE